MLKFYAVSSSFKFNSNSLECDMLETNCGFGESKAEVIDWFSGVIENKYPPKDGYFGYIYDAYEIPREMGVY